MKKRKDKSFDATLGYRPPPRERGRSSLDAPKAPVALQEPRPGLEEENVGDGGDSSLGNTSRGKRAVAGVLLCAGLVLILGFSLVSMLAVNGVGVPFLQPDSVSPIGESASLPALAENDSGVAEEGVRIKVANILQEPELPNGCETTSLAVLLGFYGYKADKMDLADNYLPKGDFWSGEWGELYAPDPKEAYPGHPGVDMLGYYCYPGVIVETANSYITAHSLPLEAYDFTGATSRRLRTLLDDGIPVIVWCTTDLEPLRTNVEFHWYYEQGGEPYYPYVNMHAMVLTGYDEQFYYFCDPLDNHSRVARPVFDDNYIEVGRRAVALFPVE